MKTFNVVQIFDPLLSRGTYKEMYSKDQEFSLKLKKQSKNRQNCFKLAVRKVRLKVNPRPCYSSACAVSGSAWLLRAAESSQVYRCKGVNAD